MSRVFFEATFVRRRHSICSYGWRGADRALVRTLIFTRPGSMTNNIDLPSSPVSPTAPSAPCVRVPEFSVHGRKMDGFRGDIGSARARRRPHEHRVYVRQGEI